ncbi:MAG: ATP phosphoribosyltransferase regulatory subunit [Clostridia bacterium]|nr:ATP phosphoribosyltransferase regulatory subunit [Clostridia bacterium]
MNQYNAILNKDEQVAFELRSLYRSYGYLPYKMSKFEEYDLYVRNKDFLVSDNVITFTDTNGRLMALKPDVTLSIIKNGRDAEGLVEKVYYNENVYRISKGTHSYKEIMQTGLECVGAIDAYRIGEVVSLAAESLKKISDRSVLDLSHLDMVSAVLNDAGLSEAGKQKIYSFLGEKNLHGVLRVCTEEGIAQAAVEAVKTLVTLYGAPEKVLPALKSLCPAAQPYVAQLQELIGQLRENGLADTVRLDFSVIPDMHYYNGIVFRGFVDGIPTGILSGGQYDKLLRKMGRKAQAIGFAVYLDLLEELAEDAEYDVDTVLLYDETDTPASVAAAVKKLAKTGSVTALRQIPAKLTYKTCISVKEVNSRG